MDALKYCLLTTFCNSCIFPLVNYFNNQEAEVTENKSISTPTALYPSQRAIVEAFAAKTGRSFSNAMQFIIEDWQRLADPDGTLLEPTPPTSCPRRSKIPSSQNQRRQTRTPCPGGGMTSDEVQLWLNRTPAQAGSAEHRNAALALGQAFVGLQARCRLAASCQPQC